MADNVYEALQQIFTIYPEFGKTDFYVTGERCARAAVLSAVEQRVCLCHWSSGVCSEEFSELW